VRRRKDLICAALLDTQLARKCIVIKGYQDKFERSSTEDQVLDGGEKDDG